MAPSDQNAADGGRSEQPTALPVLPFPAYAALLGGAAAAAWLPAAEPRLAQSLDGERAWLTPGAAAATRSPQVTEQLAREILALKLRTFAQLCEGLAAVAAPGEAAGDADETARARLHVGLCAVVPARWSGELLPPPPLAAARRLPWLGERLAELLLANDDRSPAEAAMLLPALAERFVDGNLVPTLAADIAAMAKDLDGRAVLYERAARAQLDHPPVAIEIWIDALWLLVQLRGSTPPTLDTVRTDAQALARRAEVAAHGALARRAEMAAILNEELRLRLPGTARPPR